MNSHNNQKDTDFRLRMSELSSSLFSKGEGEVWLYGSRARGDYKADSDWDLLVIVNSSLPFREAYNRFAYPFVELGWDFKQSIIPIVYSIDEWMMGENSLFYNNVIKDRIRI